MFLLFARTKIKKEQKYRPPSRAGEGDAIIILFFRKACSTATSYIFAFVARKK